MSDFDELYWGCNDSNIDEVRWAELLVQDGVVAPNIFNTFLWLENCRARIKSPAKISSLLEYLEINDHFDLTRRPPEPPLTLDRSWRGVEGLELLASIAKKSGALGLSDHERWGDAPRTNNPLEIFLRCVRRGHYPAPELLLSVAKAIDLYFMSNGKLSLEDVFFDRPSSAKQGNYSKRSIRAFKGVSYLDFHEELLLQKDKFSINGAPSNIESLALNFLQSYRGDEAEGLAEDDLDSFLRGYRRWRHAQSAGADT